VILWVDLQVVFIAVAFLLYFMQYLKVSVFWRLDLGPFLGTKLGMGKINLLQPITRSACQKVYLVDCVGRFHFDLYLRMGMETIAETLCVHSAVF
jgi:hypothetical protein